jgi:hypothetical protein
MTVTVGDAIEEARTWLETQRDGIPGYRGAYVAGSLARLPGESPMPPGSDVDVMVIGETSGHLGKAFRDGLVIEGTMLPVSLALVPDAVLRDYHLAPGLVQARILDDPDGHIALAREAVIARYANVDTIRARLDDVEARARATLASVTPDRPGSERITAWQFGVGQVAHMLLVAALENPTVRRRYIAAAEVLSRSGEDVAYERLLRLAGVNRLRRPEVEALARDLDSLLRTVGPVADASDWRFATDISAPMRPFVMDGIRAMIADGWHREAMFWIGATWCRCVQVMERDGTGEVPSIARLREALRVPDDDAFAEAVAEAMDAIPAFRELADRINRLG